ncbi:hypothetical protein [Anaerosporobacter faecicola]|uniref:hypothetical protein n=1 Tax=Anaerosporobacter faecicola TaxID=2718714 RepID=UPI00143B4C39|nr:hypothetical protein [Anaerosporobacter faecicola]
MRSEDEKGRKRETEQSKIKSMEEKREYTNRSLWFGSIGRNLCLYEQRLKGSNIFGIQRVH